VEIERAKILLAGVPAEFRRARRRIEMAYYSLPRFTHCLMRRRAALNKDQYLREQPARLAKLTTKGNSMKSNRLARLSCLALAALTVTASHASNVSYQYGYTYSNNNIIDGLKVVQLSTAGMFVSVTNENEGYMVLKSWQNEASSKKIVPLESLMSELPPYGVDPDMTLTALANNRIAVGFRGETTFTILIYEVESSGTFVQQTNYNYPGQVQAFSVCNLDSSHFLTLVQTTNLQETMTVWTVSGVGAISVEQQFTFSGQGISTGMALSANSYGMVISASSETTLQLTGWFIDSTGDMIQTQTASIHNPPSVNIAIGPVTVGGYFSMAVANWTLSGSPSAQVTMWQFNLGLGTLTEQALSPTLPLYSVSLAAQQGESVVTAGNVGANWRLDVWDGNQGGAYIDEASDGNAGQGSAYCIATVGPYQFLVASMDFEYNVHMQIWQWNP
jgi:hypothetical protein